jgi:hypothetical protein
VTDGHEGDGFAFVAQLAAEGGYWVAPRFRIGLRGTGAGAFVDDTSPFIVSVEPYAAFDHELGFVARFGVLLPLADLRNEEVPPGLGGYKISENKSLGLALGAGF